MSTTNNATNSSDMKFTVTFVVNATFCLWDKSNNSDKGNNLTFAILCVLILCSLGLNLCVISSICSSYSLKRININLCTLSIVVACVLDSAVNTPVSAYFTKRNSTNIDWHLCAINAVLLQIVPIAVSWEIAVLCRDRWLAFAKRSQRSITKHLLSSVCGWVLSIALCLPQLFGLGNIRIVPGSLGCTAIDRNNIYFDALLLIVFSFLTVFSLITLIATMCRRLRETQRFKSQCHELTYTERFFEESYMRNELKNTKFVCVVFVMFLVLALPYTIHQIYQPISDLHIDLANNVTVNSTISTSSEAASCGSYFLCLRYCFNVMFPFVVLVTKKDILRKCQCMVSWNGRSSAQNTDADYKGTNEPLTDNIEETVVARDRRRKSSLTFLANSLAFSSPRETALLQFWNISTSIIQVNCKKRKASIQSTDDSILKDDENFDSLDFSNDVRLEVYNDVTEEEINSTEISLIQQNANHRSVKEVAVQTICDSAKQLSQDSDSNHQQDTPTQKSATNSKFLTYEKLKRFTPTLSLLRSKRKPNDYKQFKNTLPAFKETENDDMNVKEEGLVSALRLRKSENPVCVVLPRGTAELLDAIVDNRNVVSL